MLVALLDLFPTNFAEGKEGMTEFSRAIFKAGQGIPLGVTVRIC